MQLPFGDLAKGDGCCRKPAGRRACRSGPFHGWCGQSNQQWRPMTIATVARIHITGASGAGVTTLGRALARRLDAPQFDVDDFYWLPPDPPFVEKRPVASRLELLGERLAASRWILSGSLVGWGDPLIPLFDLVVFIYTPAEVRLA